MAGSYVALHGSVNEKCGVINVTLLDRLENAYFAPAGTMADAYKTLFEELIMREEIYRWHDLRKNPEDLPEIIAADCLTISVSGKYIVRTYEGIGIKGFLDSYGHELKTHQREEMQVIAWRYIEPFEEDT